jgi:hypothetical protein
MMMKKTFMLFILFVFATQWNSLSAQVVSADTNVYRVVKSNKQEYIGKILSDDGREVLLETNTLGKIYIPKSDIQSITIIHPERDMVDNEYRGTGVFTTRYQFSTNAFPIEKHDNYALINLYGPEVHFSVSKQFSVGVMATWIASPIVLALKYTIPTRNEKLNFGFGTLMGSVGYLNKGRGYGGLHWAMATYGDRKNNVTVSLGYAYLNTGMNTGEQMYEPGTFLADNKYGYWEFPQLTPINYKTPTIKAPVIGLAGIATVGKKASFVVDMMFVFGKKVDVIRSQSIVNSYDQSTGYPAATTVGPVSSFERTTHSVNCLIMPGMRFQKSEHTAFQVSLAGIIGRSVTQNVGSLTVNRYSFPVPMCTWFYKF